MSSPAIQAGPTLAQLQAAVARLEDAEKLQRALYAIADMAGSDLDMPDMLRGLHRIVSDLMYAENFFIALYDQPSDSIRFLYFADAADTGAGVAPPPEESVPLAKIEQGLSWYLIRQKKPSWARATNSSGRCPARSSSSARTVRTGWASR